MLVRVSVLASSRENELCGPASNQYRELIGALKQNAFSTRVGPPPHCLHIVAFQPTCQRNVGFPPLPRYQWRTKRISEPGVLRGVRASVKNFPLKFRRT